jgi:hypothetical protein
MVRLFQLLDLVLFVLASFTEAKFPATTFKGAMALAVVIANSRKVVNTTIKTFNI